MRRKRLARLLSRSNKAMRDGIQLSEALTGDGPATSATTAIWGSKASFRSGDTCEASTNLRADSGPCERPPPCSSSGRHLSNVTRRQLRHRDEGPGDSQQSGARHINRLEPKRKTYREGQGVKYEAPKQRPSLCLTHRPRARDPERWRSRGRPGAGRGPHTGRITGFLRFWLSEILRVFFNG